MNNEQMVQQLNNRLTDAVLRLMSESQEDTKQKTVRALRAASDVFRSHAERLENAERRLRMLEAMHQISSIGLDKQP